MTKFDQAYMTELHKISLINLACSMSQNTQDMPIWSKKFSAIQSYKPTQTWPIHNVITF